MRMTEENIIALIADQLGLQPSEISHESRLEDDLGADSLDLVELVMAMEEELDIDIADCDIEHIKTVKEFIDYVKALG